MNIKHEQIINSIGTLPIKLPKSRAGALLSINNKSDVDLKSLFIPNKNNELTNIAFKRLFNDAEVEEISSWFSGNDLRNMGGNETTSITHYIKDEWKNEGLGAWVLCSNTAGGSPLLLAFVNVQYTIKENVNSLEIGRLIVNSKYRRKGIATLILQHLSILISDYDITVFARCIEDNRAGFKTLQKSWFSQCSIPNWVPQDDNHYWFKYDLISPKRHFGTVLDSLMGSKGLSKQDLATACGINNSQVTNYLKSSFPTCVSLNKMVGALNLNRRESVKLALSVIGETDDAITIGKTLTEELASKVNRYRYNLWVVSRDLREATDDKVLEDSAKAIAEGFERYYFIPEEKWAGGFDDTVYEALKEKVEEKLNKFELDEQDKESRVKKLRFYSAPNALCALKCSIENPALDDASTDYQRLSVVGIKDKRNQIQDEVAISEFVSSIRQAIRRLELGKPCDGYSILI